MASVTDTKRAEAAEAVGGGSRRRRFVGSRLGRLIFFLNLLSLTILIVHPSSVLTDHLPLGDGLAAHDFIRRLGLRGHRLHVACERVARSPASGRLSTGQSGTYGPRTSGVPRGSPSDKPRSTGLS